MMRIESPLTEATCQDFRNKVEQDLQKLRKRKEKVADDKAFIRYVFNFLHRRYLKTYLKTANFSETIAKGSYNCVGGTALIGYFLERLAYTCWYYETQKHTFLIAQVAPNDRLLIESTAFFSGGLIDDEQQINVELENYKPIAQIQAIHLVGILYYNEGVLAYESQDYLKTLSLANQAYYFYASPRHKALCYLAKQNLEAQKSYTKID
jgi:hypothetical protein